MYMYVPVLRMPTKELGRYTRHNFLSEIVYFLEHIIYTLHVHVCC